MFFKILKKDRRSKARLGLIETSHGRIHTPAFLPVATQGSIKGLSPKEVKEIGFEAVLANAYHLFLRPGSKTVEKMGGLHKFMNWPLPIATDSGGFQVFSLGAALKDKVGKVLASDYHKLLQFKKQHCCLEKIKPVKISEEGVVFYSHLDGAEHQLTPEKSIKIQEELGADLIFAFDECTSPLADYVYTKKAMERTHRWAERSLAAKKKPDQFLFGIVQGGPFNDLRKESAHFIGGMTFDGFGIGGSLGEGDMRGKMSDVLDWTIPFLPEGKPRHLLGIGYLSDIKTAVKKGIDLFDCVYPTRLARHGTFLTWQGEIDITKAKYKLDKKPISKNCSCYACQNFSRAYLHHLFRAGEMLGPRLATCHNLCLMHHFMEKIREEVKKG